MTWLDLKHRLTRFRDDTRGTIMVETVLSLPLMFLVLTLTFEFFEIHRFKSSREKATYTIADMISRENDVITDTYMDNTKTLFDEIAHDDGINQIRVSIIRYLADTDEYEVSWSKIRGVGSMNVLVDADVATGHDELPIMNDGEELIIIESKSTYDPIFEVGFDSDGVNIATRVFTSIRFAPQICFDACTSS